MIHSFKNFKIVIFLLPPPLLHHHCLRVWATLVLVEGLLKCCQLLSTQILAVPPPLLELLLLLLTHFSHFFRLLLPRFLGLIWKHFEACFYH